MTQKMNIIKFVDRPVIVIYHYTNFTCPVSAVVNKQMRLFIFLKTCMVLRVGILHWKVLKNGGDKSLRNVGNHPKDHYLYY